MTTKENLGMTSEPTPRPIDLTKPGRRYTIYFTQAWCLYGHQFGCCELERRSDGATLFMQGEDADLMRRDVEAVERVRHGDAKARDRSFNYLCAGYSDVMETR